MYVVDLVPPCELSIYNTYPISSHFSVAYYNYERTEIWDRTGKIVWDISSIKIETMDNYYWHPMMLLHAQHHSLMFSSNLPNGSLGQTKCICWENFHVGFWLWIWTPGWVIPGPCASFAGTCGELIIQNIPGTKLENKNLDFQPFALSPRSRKVFNSHFCCCTYFCEKIN